MKWFANITIARKLTVAFGVVLMMMVGLGSFAVLQFAKLYAPTYEITSNWLPSIHLMSEIKVDALLLRRYEFGYLAADTPELKTGYLKQAQDTTAKIKADLAKYDPL